MKEAYELWQENNPLEAGKIVFEKIPRNKQPFWAANILNACLEQTKSKFQFLSVLNTAENPDEWKNAHKLFCSIREITLANDKNENRNPIFGGLLILAENTAKVIYNSYCADFPLDYPYSSNCPAPFDEDSGWWIISNLKYLVEQIKESDFEKRVLKIAFEFDK